MKIETPLYQKYKNYTYNDVPDEIEDECKKCVEHFIKRKRDASPSFRTLTTEFEQGIWITLVYLSKELNLNAVDMIDMFFDNFENLVYQSSKKILYQNVYKNINPKWLLGKKALEIYEEQKSFNPEKTVEEYYQETVNYVNTLIDAKLRNYTLNGIEKTKDDVGKELFMLPTTNIPAWVKILMYPEDLKIQCNYKPIAIKELNSMPILREYLTDLGYPKEMLYGDR